MKTMTRWALMCAGLVAAGALADSLPAQGTVVQPHVMFIMDTSKSMRESPTSLIDLYETTDPGGDYDWEVDGPVGTAPCYSKFCIAKKALYNTIPNYTSSALIGFATYYQYLLTATPNYTYNTYCKYDVILPAGRTRSFTTTQDYTGGRLGDLGASTLSYVFPSQKLNTNCADSTTSLGDAGTRYILRKTAYSLGTSDFLCSQYRWPRTGITFPLSGVLAKQGCSASRTYDNWQDAGSTLYAYPTPTGAGLLGTGTGVGQSMSGYVEIVVPSAASMCEAPTAVPPGPTDVASRRITYGGDGGGLGNVGTIRGLPQNYCDNANFPCDLWSVSATPFQNKTGRFWYGFDSTFTPDAGYTGYNVGYTFGDKLATTGPATATSTQVNQLTTCTPSGSYTGNLSALNFTNMQISGAGGTPANSTNQTPTPATSNTFQTSGVYSCAADWPCQITTIQDAGLVYINGTTYTSSGDAPVPSGTAGVAGYVRWSGGTLAGATTYTGSYYVRKAAGNCPASYTAGAGGPAPSGYTWITSNGNAGTGPTCSGAAGFNCDMKLQSATTGVNLTAACTPASYVTWGAGSTGDGGAAAPTTCPQSGKAYTVSDMTLTYTVTKNNSTDTVCPAQAAGYTTTPACIASGCTLTASGAPVAGTNTTTTYDGGSPGAGYALNGGAPAVDATRSDFFIRYADGGVNTIATINNYACPGQFSNTTGTAPTSISGKEVIPGSGILTATGASNCGSEGTAPCYKCQYQTRVYNWTQPKTTCTYTAVQRTWTADTSFLGCGYQLAQYATQQLQQQYWCQYQVPVKRYDFNVTAENVCRYFMVKSQLESKNPTYTYEYKTNGSEIAGVYGLQVANKAYCSTTYGGSGAGSFAGDCPQTLASGCPTVTDSVGGGDGGVMSTTCRLNYGTSGNGSTGGTQRLQWQKTNIASTLTSTMAGLSAVNAGAECGSAETSGSTTPGTGGYTNAQFCVDNSSGAPIAQYKVVSDWYAPTVNNTTPASVYGASFNGGQYSSYTVGWSKTNNSTKNFGYGAQGTGFNSAPPSPILVPLAADNSYNSGTQSSLLKAAIRKCVKPTATADGGRPGSVNDAGVWTPDKGACQADFVDGVENTIVDGGWSALHDFTPLFGSITNARDYLASWADQDNDYSCRKRYVVLMTDGEENTPAGYNASQLVSLVSGMSSGLTTSGNRSIKIGTFVIGFGSSLTGSTVLNDMAAAGTAGGVAFNATDLPSLQNSLAAIFAQITAGTYSRARPAVSTSGDRVYATSYNVGAALPDGGSSVTPEWSGDMGAYALDPSTGVPTLRWSMQDKIDAQSTRTIKGMVVSGALPTMAATLPDLNSTNFPGAAGGSLTATRVIDFAINNSLAQTFNSNATPTPQRRSRVGAIVHSSPVVVGNASFGSDWGGSSGPAKVAYNNFKNLFVNSRDPRIIVGADDGFLRSVVDGSSVNCSTESSTACANGTEQWAVLPYETVGSLYKTLNSHTELVDGNTVVSDICYKSGGNSTDCTCTNTTTCDWKTVALGSMRGGGRSVFALDVTTPNAAPKGMWSFNDADLAYTYSAPVIGRVRYNSQDQFIALFGAGTRDNGTSVISGTYPSIYAINANTGSLIRRFPDVFNYEANFGHSTAFSVSKEVIARGATFRKANDPYMDSVVFPATDGVMYVMRFADSTGTQLNPTDGWMWRPEYFFDPTSSANVTDIFGQTTPILQVALDVAGSGSLPPTFKLVASKTVNGVAQPQTLPLPAGSAPPLYNRPKVGSLVNPPNRADYYVGTGDVKNPTNPGTVFKTNYFFGIHDRNDKTSTARNDGQPIFVRRFVDMDDPAGSGVGNEISEQVVGEATLVTGAIVVATYLPPPPGQTCYAAGRTRLYSFNPTTGALVSSLVYPAGSPYSGKQTPVLDMGNIGIPSDLVVVKDSLYLKGSNTSDVQQQKYTVVPTIGKVRSYDRVK